MEDVMDCVVQVDRSRTDGRTASDENFKLFSTNSRFFVEAPDPEKKSKSNVERAS